MTHNIFGPTPAALLTRTFKQMLSNEVRPFLKARGFTKSRYTFQRKRGPLYDTIGFQGNRHNGITPWHGFFADAGVGSTEFDAVTRSPIGPDDLPHHLLYRRWPALISGMPREYRFDDTTDMAAFAQQLCADIDRVLAVLEAIDSTEKMVQWAVDHNKLSGMERTCRYLVATGDIDSLTRYVTTLRANFVHESRWEMFFNRQLTALSGPWAPQLLQQGLLDPIINEDPHEQGSATPGG